MNWNPCALLVGIQNGTAAVGNSWVVPHNVKQKDRMTQPFSS